MPVAAEFFAFDTETTGVNPEKHQIISIAMMLLQADLTPIAGRVIHAFPDTQAEIDPQAIRVNGYTFDKWQEKGAVTQGEMFEEIQAFVGRHWRLKQIAHNLKFDSLFLEALFNRFVSPGRRPYRDMFSFFGIDTLAIAMFTDMVFYDKLRASYKLDRLAASYEVKHEDAHTAMSDLEAMVGLLRAMRDTLRRTGKVEPPKLNKLPNPILTRLDPEKDIWIFTGGKHTGKFTKDVFDSDPQYLHFVLRFPDLSEEQRTHIQSLFLKK